MHVHVHTHTHTHTKEGRLISSRRVLSSIISSPLSIKQTPVATGNKKYRLYRISPGKVTKQIVITTKHNKLDEGEISFPELSHYNI